MLADCDVDTGHLKTSYLVLHKQYFHSLDYGGRMGYIHTCTCEDGLDQHNRLLVTKDELQEDFTDFLYREQQIQCIHARTMDELSPTSLDVYRERNPIEQADQTGLLNGVYMCCDLVESGALICEIHLHIFSCFENF